MMHDVEIDPRLDLGANRGIGILGRWVMFIGADGKS